MTPSTARSRVVSLALRNALAVVLAVAVMPSPAAQAAPGGACGQTALVLDESGSIDPYEASVRSAVDGFLTSLVGSPASASIVEFGTSAKKVLNYAAIDAASIASVFEPYLDGTSGGDRYDAPSQLGPYTNWDDALDEVSIMNAADGVAPLVLFLTDGNPTAYNDDTGSPRIGDGNTEGLSRAVAEADEIKAQGSHIIAVGVGDSVMNGDSVDRLKEVSGPNVYSGEGTFDLNATDVVLVPDFAALPAAMDLIAQAMCADPAISVEKTVSQPAVIAGTEVTYHIEVSNTGNVDLHNVLLDDPLVPECNDEIGNLAVGESVTVTCVTTIWAPITNTATATGEDPFGTPVSDDGSATVTLLSTGTGTPGFWKNHEDVWPVSGGGVLVGDWNHNQVCNTDEVCLGLTEEEALEAVSTPPRGDMTWNLSRHLVTAWLNVTAGNESACIEETIDSATRWLLDHPLGSEVSGGDDAWTEASVWAETLDEYNNGLLCAEHRDASVGDDDQEPASAHGNQGANVEQPISEGQVDEGANEAVPGKAIGRPDHPGKGHKAK